MPHQRRTPLTADEVILRNNVRVLGPVGAPVILFAHGFGCDQGLFRRILPYFTDRFRTVLFDHVGSGASLPAAYDAVEYSSMERYASDLLEICEVLELHDVTVVAHSVAAMMAITAAVRQPDRFAKLVLLAPSPSYIDDPESGYVGGFSGEDIQDLLGALDDNHLLWASMMAPVVMGNPEKPELSAELEQSFCRVDPVAMRTFARVTFLTDVRPLLARVNTECLIVQCANDALAPLSVGEFMHAVMPHSTLALLAASGHVPQVSAPDETARTILGFIDAP
ncbi:alpha/beta fold hydrolase [Agreia sp. COWG]|uniref:alpha/beta fold hydrolase n=1 Tax=Agreia sp. COWG TaxID=2773266 RepID=UPI001F39D245|nr:alpha/beta hydrolase [Agreia sp. COWG]